MAFDGPVVGSIPVLPHRDESDLGEPLQFLPNRGVIETGLPGDLPNVKIIGL